MWCTSILIFLVTFIQVSVFNRCNSVDAWFFDTYNSLVKLENVATSCVGDWEPDDCYVKMINQIGLLPTLEGFLLKSQLNEPGQFHDLHRLLSYGFDLYSDDSRFKENVERLIVSPSLQEKYDSTVKALMTALKQDVDASAESGSSNGYVLPLETACATLPTRDVPTLSVRDVCPTVLECSRSFHSSTANACREDNSCDVARGVPLMVGLFLYKVSFAFVDKFCSGRCSGDGGCNMKDEYASIVKQVELLRAFVSMIPEKPFDAFYRDAVTSRAYSELGPAMRIISEKDGQFSVANVACNELEAQPACRVMSFYPNYLVLKKMKEERVHPGSKDTRDLRLHENVDHVRMIELKREALRHTQLLNAIDELNTNLETQVRGIASYFKGIANFDQGIANADVVFIRDSLTTFNSKFATLSQKVNDDVEAAMIATTTLIGVQLVEETVALVAKVVAEANPIKAVFTGVDQEGVREQAIAVAEAAADLAHIISLFAHLGGLATDTTAIATDLHDNQNQIKSLKVLVDKIQNNQVDDITADAEEFINQYAGYTPKVDRSRMAQNTAKWGAFKGSTCDLLTGVEGIGASVGKGVANGFLLCEKLEGTIAEFDALRENIFEFQFDLVDSLARVVRGNVAKKLADSIQDQEQDMFRADQLLGGFLMTQAYLQSHAWLYCDKLEYKNEGRGVQPCSPETGLFTNDELDNLVAFTDDQSYVSVERTVYIPSKPQYSGDLGYINIHALAQDKTASFRLPRNPAWLYKFHWSLMGESHAPYVESFELFLPKKEYRTGSQRVETSTRLVVSVDKETGSYISTDQESAVLYKLPERQTSYVTAYKEGYRSSTCSTEIPNPYSLCNNLPNICKTSTNVPGDSLLPTTLSRWRVSYTVQSGAEEVDWLAPNSKTDLKFIAKVTLRLPPRAKSSRAFGRTNDEPDGQPDGCCQGNTYRSSLVSTDCEDCPSESTSRLGGYYCEADPPAPSKKKHHVFLHRDSSKRRNSPVGRAFKKGRKAKQHKSEVANHVRHFNN